MTCVAEYYDVIGSKNDLYCHRRDDPSTTKQYVPLIHHPQKNMTTTTTVDDNDQHDDQDDVVLQQRITLPHSGKDVMIITLNRPKRLNCFHQHLCHRLALVVHDIVTQLQQEQPLEHNDNSSNNDRNNTHHHNKNNNVVFAVILTANGSSFCAGADLTDPPNPLEQSMDLPECLQRNPAYQLSRVPVPIIGALRGHVRT